MTTAGEASRQLDESGRIYRAMISDFDPEAWHAFGTHYMVPVRIAMHILLSLEYYGSIRGDWNARYRKILATTDPAGLPDQAGVLAYQLPLWQEFRRWIETLDDAATNRRFPWAGATQAGVR
ncbi:MAG: hypothetical protein ACOC0O_03095 [Spirochaetota bacterium]